ncbi:MAG: hypothetical protein M1343_09450 [Chloroflexi bacterium]|nr:hypothetical protein [Chloroflexota bacterium]MDA8187225.1 hypothetical protein [Dehalococcoidales bacterium]
MKKAVLICPRCGRRAERLLAVPLPRNHAQTEEAEAVVCERCLRDLEKEREEAMSQVVPPNEVEG